MLEPVTERDAEDLVSALDHLPAMVAYWDKDCRNRIANAAYVEWFGMGPNEMRGMHIRDLLGPELYERNLPYIRGVLSGEQQLFNRTLVDAKGRTRYTQASYIPRTVGTSVEGFFVLVTDISERVQAESALAESVATTALLRERQRIAADMHDLVIQNLYAVNLELAAVAPALDTALAGRVDAIIDRIDHAVDTLRTAIHGMTRQIGPEQFVGDLQQVVDNSAAGLGFRPTLILDGPAELIPAQVRPEMLAVLQEALSNVVRHASATAVTVTVTMLGPEVRLMVLDNGRGIGGAARSSGLANMRARAEQLGGSFACSDNDPSGTIIDWRVPSTLAAAAVPVPNTPAA